MQVWFVSDGLTDHEQARAQEGVHFVPYSQFPPKTIREDCVYHSTPALLVPESFENLHACEVRDLNLIGIMKRLTSGDDGMPTTHGGANDIIDTWLQNWLPRRVMSAWRAAGIVHALEEWDEHECGGRVTGVDKAWRAALAHGFRPYDNAR
jgi:aldehyde decarbonylase